MVRGKVKGTIVMQTVKYIRSHGEKGRALVPERLKHYLAGRILPTSWHPEEDHLELMHVSTELFSGPGSSESPAVWEEISRATAPVYYEGPYRSLVRKGDPTRTLASYGALWKLRHDTGDIEVVAQDETSNRIRLTGYALASPKMCASIQGSLIGLLEHAGARRPQASHPRCTSRGDELCEWELRWERD